MVLETLDRTQWSFDEALAHVEHVIIRVRERQLEEGLIEPPRPPAPWLKPEDPQARWKAEAQEQLLVALRDGDLHAQGRFSDTRSSSTWGADHGKTWILHSGHHTSISPEKWREGRFLNRSLSAMFWEYIDIRMPRFTVLAIWPEPSQTERAPGAYTTPYLALMQAAIDKFALSEQRQEKKEAIVAWLMEQTVEGERLSQNMAEVMATAIRLPSSQRGGAKRALGPALSKAS